jgi:ribonuclease-3
VPQYILKKESGPDHQKVFLMEVFILSKKFGEGNGPNKKEAQQKAALFACKKLNLC